MDQGLELQGLETLGLLGSLGFLGLVLPNRASLSFAFEVFGADSFGTWKTTGAGVRLLGPETPKQDAAQEADFSRAWLWEDLEA